MELNLRTLAVLSHPQQAQQRHVQEQTPTPLMLPGGLLPPVSVSGSIIFELTALALVLYFVTRK